MSSWYTQQKQYHEIYLQIHTLVHVDKKHEINFWKLFFVRSSTWDIGAIIRTAVGNVLFWSLSRTPNQGYFPHHGAITIIDNRFEPHSQHISVGLRRSWRGWFDPWNLDQTARDWAWGSRGWLSLGMTITKTCSEDFWMHFLTQNKKHYDYDSDNDSYGCIQTFLLAVYKINITL